MKYILSICLFSLPLALKAQLVVGSQGMTIQTGAVFSIDGLVMQPSADIIISNNQLQRSANAVPIGSGNSIERVYIFSSPLAYSGTIGFSFEDTELAGNAAGGLQLLYSSGPSENVWASGVGGTVNLPANYISTGVTSAPVVRITASQSVPLPVTVVEFIARKDASEQVALLNWKVAQEQDLKSYIIERSTDARLFSAIGCVPATGSSNYSFVDADPAEGENYYRLTMEDRDGDYAYTGVCLLLFDRRSVVFRIYPNPANAYLNISTDTWDNNSMPAVIVEASGRVVHTFNIESANTQINVSSLKAGTYLIKLNNGSVFKFVKQ